MLICICGIDGSGKSSAINWLEQYISQFNIPIVCIDPMKNGLLVRALNEMNNLSLEGIDPTLLSVCYAVDMLYCMENLKKEENQIVLMHRYDICCKLYAELSGADMDYVNAVCSKLPKASLYIYMDVQPEIASFRIKKRSGERRTPKESLHNLHLARNKYLEMISANSENLIRIENNDEFENVIRVLEGIVQGVNI